MTHTSNAYIQEYFRIRLTDNEGLNASFDAGDPAQNTNATIDVGSFFRVRFKVRETATGGSSHAFKLQYNHDEGWRDVVSWDSGSTEPVMAWQSDQFADLDATTAELLTSTVGNVNGVGKETGGTTGTIALSNQETEIEWCLMLQASSRGSTPPRIVDDGDTIDLRVVQADGTAFTGTYTNPTITANLDNTKHIGGCMSESPAHIGPIKDGNGNLYHLCEFASDSNAGSMRKSTDGGNTWTVQDPTNWPAQGDYESASMVLSADGTELHIVNITGVVDHHVFNTSTHATTPDTWGTTDDEIDGDPTPVQGSAGIVYRSDDTMIVVYRDNDGTNERSYFEQYSGAAWGTKTSIDSTASVDIEDVVIVKEAGSDKAHIFYKDATNEDIYHKSLSGTTLSSRELVDNDTQVNSWAMTTAVAWTSSGDEKVMIVFMDASDSLLYSVEIVNDGTPGTRKAVTTAACFEDPSTTTSRQPVADIAVDSNGTVYCFYARTNGDIYRVSLGDGDANWSSETLFRTALRSTHYIRCESYTHSGANGGKEVVGVIYSEEVGNYTGRTFYEEYEIPAAAAAQFMTTNKGFW